jgi:hypothetical protein
MRKLASPAVSAGKNLCVCAQSGATAGWHTQPPIRAEVIIPRSPTITRSVRANLVRTTSTAAVSIRALRHRTW